MARIIDLEEAIDKLVERHRERLQDDPEAVEKEWLEVMEEVAEVIVKDDGHALCRGGIVAIPAPNTPQFDGRPRMMQQSLNDVSEWIIALLAEGKSSYNDGASLRLCMQHGDHDGDVRVIADDGSEQRYGSSTYQEAFERVLKQHLQTGEIEPKFANDVETAAWQSWLAGGSVDAILDVDLYYTVEHDPAEDEQPREQRAGEFLLQILKQENSVRYSRFYDGTSETASKLQAEFGLEADESEAILMDEIVEQLSRFGFVTTRELENRLSDGHQDYVIELTNKGKSLVESGETFVFNRVEL